jgi:hypothetical protein
MQSSSWWLTGQRPAHQLACTKVSLAASTLPHCCAQGGHDVPVPCRAGFVEQFVELDFQYPSEGIHRRWDGGFRITSCASTPDQARFSFPAFCTFLSVRIRVCASVLAQACPVISSCHSCSLHHCAADAAASASPRARARPAWLASLLACSWPTHTCLSHLPQVHSEPQPPQTWRSAMACVVGSAPVASVACAQSMQRAPELVHIQLLAALLLLPVTALAKASACLSALPQQHSLLACSKLTFAPCWHRRLYALCKALAS